MGLSQANAFGDELETSTNYPLVRIRNGGTGDVFYARTHDHSSMAVATGSQTVSTNFDVPASAPRRGLSGGGKRHSVRAGFRDRTISSARPPK